MYSVVFLDMDNTIAENATCKDVNFVDGMYESKRPISFVIDAVNCLLRPNTQKITIVTVAQGGDLGMMEKLFWLERIHFDYDDVLFIKETVASKSVEMKRYCDMRGFSYHDCLMIDDKKSMLQEAESCGFRTMYPQQLLVDYYEWLKNKNSSIE